MTRSPIQKAGNLSLRCGPVLSGRPLGARSNRQMWGWRSVLEKNGTQAKVKAGEDSKAQRAPGVTETFITRINIYNMGH